MRYLSLVVVLLVLLVAPVLTEDTLLVHNFHVVEMHRVTPTHYSVTYSASLTNTGRALPAVSAVVSSLDSGVLVKQGTLSFVSLPANSQVESSNTFTIVVDRRVPLDFSQLKWTFQTSPVPPIAGAGRNQTAKVGSTVSLNGRSSTNPSGAGALTYAWEFTEQPEGSKAVLTDAASATPSFLVDVPGAYVATLTVSNGSGRSSASVTVNTKNSAPVAHAGRNQTVTAGAAVTLNGSRSSDVDGNSLSYAWSLTSRPAGSTAVLSAANSALPSFIADKQGTYIAQLIVNDGQADSAPATVAIRTDNTAPVSDAGANQVIEAGALAQLDGAGSTDVDGNRLTYRWSLISVPVGSSAALSNETDVNPTFTADVAGTYTAQLTVNDGQVDSIPSTVSFTTSASHAPLANAGLDQTVGVNSVVSLKGTAADSGSTPLIYRWALVSRPDGSNAALSTPDAEAPTFVADQTGVYVAQLIVNNGIQDSDPATVTIATTHTSAVARPGKYQKVSVGSAVQLDGSASTDSEGKVLSHQWSLLRRPSGSNATLTGASTVAPAFVADAPGTYVAQLIVNDGAAVSRPATVSIQAAGTPAISLTPSPLAIATIAPGSLTLTLSAPAGSGGQVVSLSSSNAGVASVPNSVTVAEGATTADIAVTPNNPGTATINATAGGFGPGSATVNVVVPAITVTLDFSNVGLTRTINGTVSINVPAPASGFTISLSANPSGIVTIPASVSIAPGSTTASFTVTGNAEGSTQIIASSPGFTTGSASVQVSKLGQILLPVNVTVGPNQTVPYPITLLTPAPVGGVTIALSSADFTKVTISSTSVTIPQGSTTPATQPTITGLNFGTTTISASAPGFAGDTQTVHVAGSLTFVPSSVTLGTNSTQNILLTLSGPAPAGLTINLSSDHPNVATVPSTVTFAAGSTSVNVPVTNISAGFTVIRASSLPNLAETTANVAVASLGGITLPQNVSVGSGQSIPFPIVLTGSAPAGGTTVTLQSSDPSKATITPTTVFIAAGAVTPATQPQLLGVNFGTATITASAPGLSSNTQQVQVVGTLGFSPSSATINGPVTQNLTLTLASPAPAGFTVALSSSNTAAATVPASVTFATGATSATVPVTAVGLGTTSIVANANSQFVTNAMASVSVTGTFVMGSIGLPANVKVGTSQSVPFPITLSTPAPAGGLTVSLTSSDPSVTVTPSVVVAAGATQPATQPQVTGVNFGSSIISAMATGYASASQTVQVTDALSFAPASLTLAVGATQNLVLNLSSPAPAGGLMINISSSNPGTASVPATVTIAANATSVNVPVAALGAGTTTITASSNIPNVTGATASVTVSATPDILLPAGTVVAPGQQTAFPITLVQPAPAGGIFVTLSSSDSSTLTVSPSQVFIPQGATTTASPVQITGVKYGSATITASAAGLTGGAQTVQVASTLSFVPAIVSISGFGVTQTITLTASAPAPASGFLVNLSSTNPAVATVPATVTFAPNATTANVTVTSVGPGSTTLHAGGVNLTNASAIVNVMALGSISLPANVSVNIGQTAPFAITLGTPAPAGGVTVTLTSSDSSKIALSSGTVFIPQGSTTPTVQPVLTGLNIGSVTITASAPGYAAASQTVQGKATASFSPQSIIVVAGATQTVQLVLSAPAPASGLTLNLTSDNPAIAQIQPAVTFANQTTMVVSISGVSPGTTVIHAGASPFVPDTTITVTVVAPATILLPSGVSLAPGTSMPFPVTLTTPAPAGGLFVALTSSDTSKVVVLPSKVFIAAGNTMPGVQPTVAGVGSGSANVTATAPGYVSATQSVQVGAGQSSALSFAPQTLTINGATLANLTLTLSAPAAQALTITLSSSSPGVATVPGTVTLAAGATSISVPVQGVAAGSTTITASSNSPTVTGATANVTVAVVNQPGSIGVPASLKIAPNQTVAFPVTLSSAAPAGGLTVSLSSNNPSVTVTPSVFIAAGAVTPATQPQVTGVGFGNATITASAPGFTTATGQIQVAGALSFSPSSLTLNSGASGNLVLSLSSPAPAGGIVVNLVSTNPGAISVPATVTFAANATSVNVPATAVGSGTATITASTSAPNVTGATATVSVAASADIILPSGITLMPGDQMRIQVQLAQPAPAGGLFVTLSSSDPSKLTISPVTLFIPEGRTSSAVSPLLTAIDFGLVTITASAPGLTSATQTVRIGTASGFSPTSLTINGTGATQNLMLNLASPAPSGGLIVNLSSTNPGVATVPATLTVPANASSLIVPVTSVGAGSTVIHASGSGLPDTTANVTVAVAATSLSFSPPTLTISGTGNTQSLILSLSSPAPAGGVTVNVSSSNPGVATVPSTVTFPANGSTVTVPVTSVGAGSTVIHASGPGLADTTVAVSVVTSASIGLQPIGSVPSGQTVSFALTLGSPAPQGGVFVTLTSSDSSKISVGPSTVYIAGGNTSPAVQPHLTAMNVGSVTISASAPGYAPASETVVGTATVSFSQSAITLPAGTAQRVLLSLSSAAPPGTSQAGRCESPDPSTCSVTVNLSSDDPSVAQVQSTISFFPDGSSQAINQLTIYGVGPGTTVIHAGAPPFIPDTTLTVVVTASGAMSVSSNR